MNVPATIAEVSVIAVPWFVLFDLVPFDGLTVGVWFLFCLLSFFLVSKRKAEAGE